MMWLIAQWNTAWMVAVKTLLLYITALVGLRLATRRTLAQMSLFDFVTALAVGAVTGRTATANDTSYLQGAVALVTLIVLHRMVSLLRCHTFASRALEHRVRVLMVDGQVRTRQLWICGLTVEDVHAVLRQHHVPDTTQVKYMLYERTGHFTIVRHGEHTSGLVGTAIRDAADAPAMPERS
jgi:uncharacterized membrane protein YcaP (DUF421 family)